VIGLPIGYIESSARAGLPPAKRGCRSLGSALVAAERAASLLRRRLAGINRGGALAVRLEWEGKPTQVERLALPFQTVETINESRATRERDTGALFGGTAAAHDARNLLVWGDNKLVMSSLAGSRSTTSPGGDQTASKASSSLRKIDAVPGITTSLRVTPTRLGTYPAGCTELCRCRALADARRSARDRPVGVLEARCRPVGRIDGARAALCSPSRAPVSGFSPCLPSGVRRPCPPGRSSLLRLGLN
jgi:hypothetical protein